MSDFDDAVRWLKLDIDPLRANACRYLESKGKRFCVDFGYENVFDVIFKEFTCTTLQ